MIPEFAIIGHPNEGKSSVLSTLAEDDSVVISPIPGETQVCRTFPIVIDGKEILHFIDTPGFQNPPRILAGIKKCKAKGIEALRQFRELEKNNPELADDCELLTPIINGAAIIYVVDGSRPLRTVDKIEMEILRLSTQPRMAILNNKENGIEYLDQWKNEFKQQFNVFRMFNAHRATYSERISLLQTLKAIDQDLEPTLETIVHSFQKEWLGRNRRVAAIIGELLKESITHTITSPVSDDTDIKALEKKLHDQYCKTINSNENLAQQEIRSLFKHNIFNIELPPNSILHQDLFSDVTWNFLGLSKKQMIMAGGMGGATIGATADMAAQGFSFGIFTSLGAIIGSAGTLLGGKKISKKSRFLGLSLGGEEYRIGPSKNQSFPFILLDRALLFYSHIINWAHGRRETEPPVTELITTEQQGITATMTRDEIKICEKFFKNIRSRTAEKNGAEAQAAFTDLIQTKLLELSTGESKQ